ncbi:MAG: thioredoxin domain-containing protein [Bdellovibrionota bacterium]
MKKITTSIVTLGLLAGCVSSEGRIRETLKKNPDIVFDVIEANPEKFVDVVNRAAQVAQAKQSQQRVAERQQQRERDLKNPKQPHLDSVRRLSGSDAGKIVVVEYADFQCPACGAGHAALEQLKKKYGKDLQFYYKNMPLSFHEMAAPSALYFEALMLQDKTKAEKFYNLLFENQRQLSEAFLKQSAKKLGADMARLTKDMNSDVVKKRIEADMSEFQDFGFSGTPSLIVNGVALEGAQRFESLDEMVSSTLTKKN